MKEFNQYFMQRLYYVSALFFIAFMTTGVIVAYSRFPTFNVGYTLHIVLVVLLSFCLLIYPKYETHVLKVVIILIGTAYSYNLFFLYTETLYTIIFICFIPAISILFFDSSLFYFCLLFNGLCMTITFSYISLFDTQGKFIHIKSDLIGNIIDIIGSQIILYLIYFITLNRIKKLQLYYEQIQQTERLKTTGQLAAAVAHEIRNPLTVVKGFLQFYENDQSFGLDVKRNFSLMVDELDSAEYVITQFLTVAKPDKNKIVEIVDVKVIIQSVKDLIKSYGLLHDNNIDLDVQDNLFITINSIEFKQLLINLVKNAIEASNTGDSVLIRAKKKKDFVEIQITDQGYGMSEEEIKSLGTPFYSLKCKGTGLGLMICFNIVEKYEGKIQFTSTKGKGTTVTIRFPVHLE